MPLLRSVSAGDDFAVALDTGVTLFLPKFTPARVQVGKADYENERQAPKGMEWRTWEGQKLPQKDDDDN